MTIKIYTLANGKERLWTTATNQVDAKKDMKDLDRAGIEYRVVYDCKN